MCWSRWAIRSSTSFRPWRASPPPPAIFCWFQPWRCKASTINDGRSQPRTAFPAPEFRARSQRRGGGGICHRHAVVADADARYLRGDARRARQDEGRLRSPDPGGHDRSPDHGQRRGADEFLQWGAHGHGALHHDLPEGGCRQRDQRYGRLDRYDLRICHGDFQPGVTHHGRQWRRQQRHHRSDDLQLYLARALSNAGDDLADANRLCEAAQRDDRTEELKPRSSNGDDKMLRSLKSFLQDRAGNVMIMFAGMGIGMTLMVGAGVDYTRAVQFKSALQALADASVLAGASVYVSDTTAASGIATAQAYWNNGLSRLPFNSGVGTASFTTSSDAGGFYVHVAVPTSTIKTTFLSLVTNSIGVVVSATAKDPIVTATINLNGWTSDAGDGNSIYWYKIPQDHSIPAFNSTTTSNGTYNLIFSNVVTTPATLSSSIA